MKRIFLFLSLLSVLCFLAGCDNKGKISLNEQKETLTNKEYKKKEEVKETSSKVETKDRKEDKKKLLNSGLVLGLKKDHEDMNEPAEYETIWIAQNEKNIKVYRKKGVIIAPFITGLKKIENQYFELEKLNEFVDKNKKNYYERDYEYKYNFNSLVQADLGKEPSELENEDILNIEHEDGTYRPIQTKNEEIIFVGNNEILTNINEYYGTGGTLRSGRYYNRLYNLSNLNLKEKNEDIFKYIDEVTKEEIEALNEDAKSEKKGDLVEYKKEFDTDNLYMSRKNGRWVFAIPSKESFQHHGNGSYFEGVSDLTELSLKVPKELTCYDELSVPFETIKSKIPNARDAVSSPNGGMLVVVTDDKINVYINSIEDLSNPDHVIPIDREQTIVLNQWALGKYVDIWTDEIKDYFEKSKEANVYEEDNQSQLNKDNAEKYVLEKLEIKEFQGSKDRHILEIKPRNIKPGYTKKYNISTEGELDTVGVLYNENFEIIEKNDDSGISNNFSIIADLQTNSTYYLEIYEKNNTSGEYSLISNEVRNHDVKEKRAVTGKISMPNGELANRDIDVCLSIIEENNGQAVTELLTIKEGMNSIDFKIHLKEGRYYFYYYFPDVRRTYEFKSAYYNEKKSVAQKEEATKIIIGREDISGINIELRRNESIEGVITLPNDKVAPKGGIYVRLEAIDADNKYNMREVFIDIPEGKNSTGYQMFLDEGTYKVKYSVENHNGFIDAYYNDAGMFLKQEDGDWVCVEQDYKFKDVDIELIEVQCIEGKVHLPKGEDVPKCGIDLDIVALKDNGEFYSVEDKKRIKLEEGKNFVEYEFSLIRGDYIIKCAINSEEGEEEVYYSDIGTVENIEIASVIELRDSKVENVDFNLFSIN